MDSAIPASSDGPTSVTPPVAAAPAAVRAEPSGSDKIWAILSHLSSFFGVGIILPLVVYLAMKTESAYVRENAKEALNFHLSLFIYALCAIPLIFIVVGIPLLIALGIFALIMSIIAAVKASDGSAYRYPLTIRLVS